MALNKAALAQKILSIMTEYRRKTEIDDSGFADALASAIDEFVKTGEVPAGIPVATTGTAAAQSGTTTAPAFIM